MVQCSRHLTTVMLVLGMAVVAPLAAAAAQTAAPSQTREPVRQEDARQFGNRLDGQIAGVCPVPGDGPPIGGPGDRAPLPHTRQRLAEGGPLVILALGSSSTQGYGAPRPEASYPFRLERDLARRYPDSRIQVVNAGVGGEIAADQLARLDKLLAENKPDLVIWQAGTNDALRAVDRVRFAGELRDGLARIRAHGADALLMDLQVYPGARDPETYGAYVALMRRLARETATPLYSRFDLMTAWENDRAHPSPDLLFTDRFHLNTIGYACIARALGSAIAHAVDLAPADRTSADRAPVERASADQAPASAATSAPVSSAGSDQRMARDAAR